MKKFLAFLFFTLFLYSCKEDKAKIPGEIRKYVKEINDDSKEYSRKQVDDIVSASGATITGYYRDDEIKKIYTEVFTDTRRVFTTYYFAVTYSTSGSFIDMFDNRLIFVDEQDFVYNKSAKYTEEVARANNDSVWYDDKKTKLVVNHYYFHNNKLIKWTVDDTDIPVTSPAFINKEPEIWAMALLYLKELKEQ